MQEVKQVRVVRKRERMAETGNREPTETQVPPATERELKVGVARWIQEHRQRAEEFRRAAALVVRTGVFQPPG
jgi:hypothetical protein